MTSESTNEHGAPGTADPDDEHQDHDAPERCRKCAQRFDETDTRFVDSRRRHPGTPFCGACVDRCHDTEIADHWCMIDQWRTETRA